MKARVKVKSFKIISGKKNKYIYQFSCCDIVYVCDKKYTIGIDNALKSKLPFEPFDESLEYTSNNVIFNFIAMHSKETFIIEVDLQNKVVTEAELIYG